MMLELKFVILKIKEIANFCVISKRLLPAVLNYPIRA